MASEKEGVPTEILHMDYRNIPKDRKFDKITSIEVILL
jgi:cyclopropane fatty-acyl-phospholipid synthase-like methyltransferase